MKERAEQRAGREQRRHENQAGQPQQRLQPVLDQVGQPLLIEARDPEAFSAELVPRDQPAAGDVAPEHEIEPGVPAQLARSIQNAGKGGQADQQPQLWARVHRSLVTPKRKLRYTYVAGDGKPSASTI